MRCRSRLALALALALATGCGRVGFDRTDGGGAGGPGTDGAGPAFDALVGVNVVFATSTAHVPGDLGNLAAADAICAARATAVGLTGTYVPWLSTTTQSAPARLAGARGWVRPDGRPVFDTFAQLATGELWYPFDRDESAAPIRTTDAANVVVATATHMDGSFSGSDCSGLTSTVGSIIGGRADVGTRNWTEGLPLRCDQPARLYCFGVDHTTPVSVAPGTYRRAFITETAAFAHNAGIGAADSLCQSDATAAGLTGSYRALLATTGASAISRFDLGGPPWARVDGVLLAETTAAFAANAFLAPLNVTAKGAYLLPGTTVTTGADGANTAGSDTTTCVDWTRSSSNQTRGITEATSVTVFSTVSTNCVAPAQLYCLEQ